MKNQPILSIFLTLALLPLTGCGKHSESKEGAHEEGEHHGHKIVVTSPVRKNVVSTQPYVCQIHSCKHIEVRALEGGYLQEIRVNEGQAVKKGELMFQILPTLYQARLDSEIAEAQRIQIELTNAQQLNLKGIVSPQEIAIKQAELAKAQAKVMLVRAELNFASVKAPFDGIVDRQRSQLGSLIEEGDILTTFSDNSLMWVYFNVPEARYLEYKEELSKASKAAQAAKMAGKAKSEEDGDNDDDDDDDDDVSQVKFDKSGAAPQSVSDDSPSEKMKIELKLADGEIFPQSGKIGAIEADFNNTTGNIPFRADFSNPDGLLRNGQTGTILIHRMLNNALVIPQRTTFPILDKIYVYVVDEDGVVHQRYITIKSEQEDIFVVDDDVLKEGEKIIFEGIRQVRDGEKIEYEFRDPEEILANLKYHAE